MKCVILVKNKKINIIFYEGYLSFIIFLTIFKIYYYQLIPILFDFKYKLKYFLINIYKFKIKEK